MAGAGAFLRAAAAGSPPTGRRQSARGDAVWRRAAVGLRRFSRSCERAIRARAEPTARLIAIVCARVRAAAAAAAAAGGPGKAQRASRIRVVLDDTIER